MRGRGRHGGRVGFGSTGRGCGRGRGHKYSGANSAPKKGLYANLGNNIFDYGNKAPAK